MLFIKFELIPIKIGFFINFKICSKIGPKTMGYSTGYFVKNGSERILHFYNFFDTYTCSHVVYQV